MAARDFRYEMWQFIGALDRSAIGVFVVTGVSIGVICVADSPRDALRCVAHMERRATAEPV